ncbi:unnamed protein product [Aureobasidium vineae]|uniref:Uncharacterized protein n=1 Tax=Aureobasidium vineae TaxID=2773715 RepID=A0A9N8P5A1_9PEZI|nr:unnamed protein product [Aureobasidium vineae]
MTIAQTTDMNRSRKTAWSGKVLIPMWTMQIAATLTNIAGYILFLSRYESPNSWAYYDDYTNTSRASFAYISAVILVILWFIALCMIIFEIVRFHKKNLPAKTMLTSQIILSVFSSIAFIIEMLGLFAIIYGGYKSLLDWFGTIVATRKLAKRESKNSYGMTGLNEETGQGKGDQI